MMKLSLLAGISCLISSAAWSQSVISDVPAPSAEIHPEFGVPVISSFVADVNSDGAQDSVLLIDENCEEGLCPWVIMLGGSDIQVNGGYASSITRGTWRGPGPVQSRVAVVADGISWGMLDGHTFPVNDIIGTGKARGGIPSSYEASLIAEHTPFGPQDPALFQVWRENILPDQGDEIIVTVPAAGSPLVGTPWFIISGQQVAAYGWSLDWPRIYPDSGGATVVSMTRSDIAISRVE